MNINTNLSSLIVHSNLKTSTNGVNTAIERMTSGFKINRARDNAANYSISTKLSSQISAYNVAEENALAGLDMITTATENLDLITNYVQRLRDLAEQASNGTYGEYSLNAINSEANAIVDEIERLQNSNEYNGIDLTNGRVTSTEESTFIKDIKRRDTSRMKKFESVAEDKLLESGTYSISTPYELAKLATMTNNGLIGECTEFVLAKNIDLSGIANWTPIGLFEAMQSHDLAFNGIFDGNGYTISGLKFQESELGSVGLFGTTYGATIKNLSIEEADIDVKNATFSSILVGYAMETTIDNCLVEGEMDIAKSLYLGSIAGNIEYSSVSNCKARAAMNITNFANYSGGFIGAIHLNSKIKNSSADVSINTISSVAGFIGVAIGQSLIENSYANVDITNTYNNKYNAAFINNAEGVTLNNCYSKGTITSATGKHNGFIATAGWDNVSGNLVLNNCYNLTESNSAMASFITREYSFEGEIILNNCSYSDYYESKGTPVSSVTATLNNVKSCSADTVPFIIETNGKIFNYDSTAQLQIGTTGEDCSQLELNLSSANTNWEIFRNIGEKSAIGITNYLTKLDGVLARLNAKSVEFASSQNRLESVLEEISIKYDNLISTQSTIRDADIAEESSAYIRNQILQQASATLLATANQTPYIALQLL